MMKMSVESKNFLQFKMMMQKNFLQIFLTE